MADTMASTAFIVASEQPNLTELLATIERVRVATYDAIALPPAVSQISATPQSTRPHRRKLELA